MALPRWIPPRYRKYVKEAWEEEQEPYYWVQLKPGYQFASMGTTVIADDTVESLIDDLNSITKA